jgi:hypothetical protein
MPRVNRRDHSAGPAQDVGLQAKRALFKSVWNCCCTTPVTLSVASVPCQHSARTFLDCKTGTRPEQCGFQVWKQSHTLSNFLVNLGNFLYLLSSSSTSSPNAARRAATFSALAAAAFSASSASANMRVAMVAEGRGASGGEAGRSASGAAHFLGGSVFCALFASLLLLLGFIVIIIMYFWAVSVVSTAFYAHRTLYSCYKPITAVKRHMCSEEPQQR